MHSLLYLFYLIIPTIIIYRCTTVASHHNRRYELPDIEFYDQHRYAVENITLELITSYQDNFYSYYVKSYRVKVSLGQPRDFNELQRLHPNYKFVYRLWEASTNSPAIFQSHDFIDTNLEKVEFTLEDIFDERLYFIRIYTIIDSIVETLSTLKFFKIKHPYRFDQNSESRIITYDSQYAPGLEVDVENKNLKYGYKLRFALQNRGLQRDVKAFRIDLEKNFAIINSTSLTARGNHVLRYRIPYVSNDEYVIRVTSILNSNMVVASEYSVSKFFVIP